MACNDVVGESIVQFFREWLNIVGRRDFWPRTQQM